MTMMIMRFHKLIQSKLLWICFLGIIVVTFVFWGVAGTSGSSGGQQSRADDVVATFMGEDITWIELDKTRDYLSEFSRGEIPDEELDDRAYGRLTAMIHAEKLGVLVPFGAAQQQFLSNFAGEDGNLDNQRIADFEQSLARRGLSLTDAIRYVHQELTIGQYYQALGPAGLVSGHDLARFGRRASDELVIDYAEVPRSNVLDSVTVSEESLSSFFADHLEQFELGEARQVKALIVPVQPLTDTNAVTAAEAEEFYLANPDRFSRPTQPAEGDTNAVAGVENIPFEEVKGQILLELRDQLALEVASENAMAFSVKLFPRYGKRAPTVEELIAMDAYTNLNLQVSTSSWFRADDPLVGFQNGADVSKVAFELSQDDMGRVSDPVEGLTEHYVLVLDGVKAPRTPDLDEVRERVEPAATNFYVNAALDTLASNKVTELKTLLATETNIVNAIQGLSLVATSTPPFQLMNLSPYGSPWPIALAQEAATANAGEVIGPVSDYSGSRFFGVVRSRTEKPEDLAEVSETSKDRLSMQIMSYGFSPRHQEEFLLAQLKRDKKYLKDDEAAADSN